MTIDFVNPEDWTMQVRVKRRTDFSKYELFYYHDDNVYDLGLYETIYDVIEGVIFHEIDFYFVKQIIKEFFKEKY